MGPWCGPCSFGRSCSTHGVRSDGLDALTLLPPVWDTTKCSRRSMSSRWCAAFSPSPAASPEVTRRPPPAAGVALTAGPRGPSWMRCQNSASRLFAMRSQKCRTDSNSRGTGTSARGEGRRNGTSIASLCSAVSWYDDEIAGPRPPPWLPRPGPSPTPRPPGCLPRPARPRPYPGASNRPIARVPNGGRRWITVAGADKKVKRRDSPTVGTRLFRLRLVRRRPFS